MLEGENDLKRSEINAAIRAMEDLTEGLCVSLPPFCRYTPEQWQSFGSEYDEIRVNRLGWDITDYGTGDFDKTGFALITLRNGDLTGNKDIRTYAEKLLMLKEGQHSPMHFHWHKQEDIINRGGGNLIITLYASTEEEGLSTEDLTVSCDGVKYQLKSGESITLTPGESITLIPRLYHDFRVEEGSGDVLIGEVSTVNDDERDNRFHEPVGRFPEIEEDEPPYRLLCTEYP